MKLQDAGRIFAEYHQKHSSKKYARYATARINEFVEFCYATSGVNDVEDVTPAQIRKYLAQKPKRASPGAWRSRYILLKRFFHYLVFFSALEPEQNPMANTPTTDALTNKHMLSRQAFEQLLLVIPHTHHGMQDKLCCQLLWHGYGLQRINALTIHDIPSLPEAIQVMAGSLVVQQSHVRTSSVFTRTTGETRYMYGQKLNRRLKAYAKQANIPDAERLSSSLIYQSGAHFHWAGTSF